MSEAAVDSLLRIESSVAVGARGSTERTVQEAETAAIIAPNVLEKALFDGGQRKPQALCKRWVASSVKASRADRASATTTTPAASCRGSAMADRSSSNGRSQGTPPSDEDSGACSSPHAPRTVRAQNDNGRSSPVCGTLACSDASATVSSTPAERGTVMSNNYSSRAPIAEVGASANGDICGWEPRRPWMSDDHQNANRATFPGRGHSFPGHNPAMTRVGAERAQNNRDDATSATFPGYSKRGHDRSGEDDDDGSCPERYARPMHSPGEARMTGKGTHVTGARGAGVATAAADNSDGFILKVPSQPSPSKKTDRWSALEVSIPRLNRKFPTSHESAHDCSLTFLSSRGGSSWRSESHAGNSESRGCAEGEKSGAKGGQVPESPCGSLTFAEKSRVSVGGAGGVSRGSVEDNGSAEVSVPDRGRSPADSTKERKYTHSQTGSAGEQSAAPRDGRAAPNLPPDNIVSSHRPPVDEDDDEESTAGSGEESCVDPPRPRAILGGAGIAAGERTFPVRDRSNDGRRQADYSATGQWPSGTVEIAPVTSAGVLPVPSQVRPPNDQQEVTKTESMVSVKIDSAGAVTYVLTPDAPRRGKWSRLEEEFAKRIIHDFDAGLLDAEQGTGLRQYLASKLQCEVMRVSKKFCGWASVGKRSFRPVRNLNGEATRAQASLHALEQRWLKTFVPSNGAARLALSNPPSSSSGSSSAGSLIHLVPPAPLPIRHDSDAIANLHWQTAPPPAFAPQGLAGDDAERVLRQSSGMPAESLLNMERHRHCDDSSNRQVAATDRTAAAAGAPADSTSRVHDAWGRGEEQQQARSSPPNIYTIARDGDATVPPASRRGHLASDGLICRGGESISQHSWHAERSAEQRRDTDAYWEQRPRHEPSLHPWMRGDHRGHRGGEIRMPDGSQTASGRTYPPHVQPPDHAGSIPYRPDDEPSRSKEWSSTPGPRAWCDRNEHEIGAAPQERSKRTRAECSDGGMTAQPYPIYRKYGRYSDRPHHSLPLEAGAQSPHCSPTGSSVLGNEHRNTCRGNESSITISRRDGEEVLSYCQSRNTPRAGGVAVYPTYGGPPATQSTPRRGGYPPMGYQVDRHVGYHLPGQHDQRRRENHGSSGSSGSNGSHNNPELPPPERRPSFPQHHVISRFAHVDEDGRSPTPSDGFSPGNRGATAATAKAASLAVPAPAEALLRLSSGHTLTRSSGEGPQESEGGGWWSETRHDRTYDKTGSDCRLSGDGVASQPGSDTSYGGCKGIERRRHSDIEFRDPARHGESAAYHAGEQRRYSDNAGYVGGRTAAAEAVAARGLSILDIASRRWAVEAGGSIREAGTGIKGELPSPGREREGGQGVRVYHGAHRTGDPGGVHAHGGQFSGHFGRRKTVGPYDPHVEWPVSGAGRLIADARENGSEYREG